MAVDGGGGGSVDRDDDGGLVAVELTCLLTVVGASGLVAVELTCLPSVVAVEPSIETMSVASLQSSC